MKWKQANNAGYVWWWTIALSVVASELNNYCYFLITASYILCFVMLTDNNVFESKSQGWPEMYY